MDQGIIIWPMLFNFRAVAGRVRLGTRDNMSPSLQAYLAENNTISVYADDKVIIDNVTLLDGAAVAILAGLTCYIFRIRYISLGVVPVFLCYFEGSFVCLWFQLQLRSTHQSTVTFLSDNRSNKLENIPPLNMYYLQMTMLFYHSLEDLLSMRRR